MSGQGSGPSSPSSPHRPGKEQVTSDTPPTRSPSPTSSEEEEGVWEKYPRLVSQWVEDMEVPDQPPQLQQSYDKAFAAVVRRLHSLEEELVKYKASIREDVDFAIQRDTYLRDGFYDLEKKVDLQAARNQMLQNQCQDAREQAQVAEHKAENALERVDVAREEANQAIQMAHAMGAAFVDAADNAVPLAEEDPEEDPEEEPEEEDPEGFWEPEGLDDMVDIGEQELLDEPMDDAPLDSDDEGSVVTTESDISASI